MKKYLFRCIILICITTLIIFSVPFTSSAKDTFYDTAKTLLVKPNIETDAGFSEGSSTVQGGCTDGKYAYFIIHGSATRLLKYDLKNFKLVDMVDCIGFDHANDITYNSKLNRLVVTNNSPHYDVLTVLNPDTLEVTSNQKLKLDVYSISYNEKTNQYVVGISGTYDYAVLDGKFKVVKKYSGVNTGYTRQGCDSDNEYIYFVQGEKSNIVVVYDNKGNLVKKIKIDENLEVENMFHVGTDFYITMHYYGNYVYRIGLSKDKDIKFKVKYDPAGGEGKMDSTTVIYGKDTPLSVCTFKKDGYIFGGWIVRRDYDGSYLGTTKNSDDYSFMDEDDIYDYTLYGDGTNVSKTTRLGNITLKAMWVREKYTVKYDPGESDTGKMNDVMVGYSEDYKIPKNQFQKNGYIFTSFTAQRTYDDRYLGYTKGSDALKWLDKNDVSKYYEIQEGESLKKLTYDGSVVLTPNFKNAYTYNEAKTSIEKYEGVDRIVNIPEEEGVFSISQGAFTGRNMEKINFRSNITTVANGAFTDCKSLKEVCFHDYYPENISPTAFQTGSTPYVYLEHNGERIFLGWFIDRASPGLIKSCADCILNSRDTGQAESTQSTELINIYG